MFSNVFNMFSCFYGDLHQLRSIRFRFSQSLAKEGMLSAVPFTLRDLCARGTLAEKTSRVEDFERLWAKSRCAAHCVRAIHLRAKNRSAPPGAPEIRHRAAPVDATWPPQRGLFEGSAKRLHVFAPPLLLHTHVGQVGGGIAAVTHLEGHMTS